MDITPVLEADEPAKEGIWYVLSPSGVGPSARVGHSCLAVPSRDELGCSSDELYVIGGATPEGPFPDVFLLTVAGDNFEWTKVSTEGFIARYEHGFSLSSKKNKILIFGGAQTERNLNDIQLFDIDKKIWASHLPEKDCPCPRTCHSVATWKDKIYVFGGGHAGAMPVTDNSLYCFDIVDLCWTKLKTEGEPPLPRHGHIMAAVNNKIYIHGGMEGVEIYDDLYSIDLGDMRWTKVTPSGDLPSGRAAHAVTIVGSSIYIFGGMSKGGALDDIYVFLTDELKWKRLSPEGSPPHPRLDHSLTSFQRQLKVNSSDSSSEDSKTIQTETLLFIFGGMDTRGEIFGDCYVLKVPSS